MKNDITIYSTPSGEPSHFYELYKRLKEQEPIVIGIDWAKGNGMNMDEMTEEMIEAAHALQAAADRYRELYEAMHGGKPVVWVGNNETGGCVFIADSFNADRIRLQL